MHLLGLPSGPRLLYERDLLVTGKAEDVDSVHPAVCSRIVGPVLLVCTLGGYGSLWHALLLGMCKAGPDGLAPYS